MGLKATLIAMVGLFGAAAAPVIAEEKAPIDYTAVMETMNSLVGGVVEQSTKNGQRTKVDNDFMKLQQIGLLNADITQTFINTHQNPAALAMATQLAVMVIISHYRTAPIDKCAFVANLMVPDEYGNAKKIPVFGFGFDRKLFNKINWDNFENSSLPKVSYKYQMSSWALEHFMD